MAIIIKQHQMRSKISLILLFSIYMTSAMIGQEKLSREISQRKTYVTKFDKSKVIYKETGQKIPNSELLKIVEDNPRVFLENETDDEGNVLRYLYDPNNQNVDSAKKILDSYISGDVPFPNFRVSTIDGEKIELKDLKGKLVILRFESKLIGLQFNKPWIEELDEKINALVNKEEVEAIIIYQASEDEIREDVELTDTNFKLVADGRKIAQKYYINQTPTTFLIDKNGKLIGIYRNIYKIKLEDHLSN
ncbi:MAG: redoxin domain-containing protein [Bacteroidales bacterium]|nr:redoxin domain-containing protein [Bacteroidales bacterium]